MKGITEPYDNGKCRVHDACGIAGFINIDGKRENGERIEEMLVTMRERENGLGAGYAAYGLFPNYKDYYCLQVLLDDMDAKECLEEYLKSAVDIKKDERVYTKYIKTIKRPYPIVWRFFVDPERKMKKLNVEDASEYMTGIVMHVNGEIEGAFCMSSGKNMAVFKGNGWSDEIAEFYDIARYKGYMWIGHSRFPTNAPGWWGGAHPFNILDWSVSHNGEITSYGTNRRYVEMHGYKCTLLTDSEVVAYLWDLLVRKHGMPITLASVAFAPPYYSSLEEMPKNAELFVKAIRSTYKSAMINGPFSIAVGTNTPVPTLIGLTDRKKLRPIVAGSSNDGNTVFVGSEECSIKRVENSDMELWAPKAGSPVIAQVGRGLVHRGTESPLKGMEIKLPGE